MYREDCQIPPVSNIPSLRRMEEKLLLIRFDIRHGVELSSAAFGYNQIYSSFVPQLPRATALPRKRASSAVGYGTLLGIYFPCPRYPRAAHEPSRLY